MRLQQFIDELHEAGWKSTADAQWTNITELHTRLWPDIAALEGELSDCMSDVMCVSDQLNGLKRAAQL